MAEKHHHQNDLPRHHALIAIAAICVLGAIGGLTLLIFFAPSHVGNVGSWVVGCMVVLGLGLGALLGHTHPPDEKKD